MTHITTDVTHLTPDMAKKQESDLVREHYNSCQYDMSSQKGHRCLKRWKITYFW